MNRIVGYLIMASVLLLGVIAPVIGMLSMDNPKKLEEVSPRKFP